MKLFVEIGEDNTGKTTRIHKLARMIEQFLAILKKKGFFVKKPTRELSPIDYKDINRTYKILCSNHEIVITLASAGDGPKQVETSYSYGAAKKADIHIMATRKREFVNNLGGEKFFWDLAEDDRLRKRVSDIEKEIKEMIKKGNNNDN